MKDIYEVIKQKESQIQQLQKDLDTLKAAAALLADAGAENANGSSKVSGAVRSGAEVAATTSWEPAKRWP